MNEFDMLNITAAELVAVDSSGQTTSMLAGGGAKPAMLVGKCSFQYNMNYNNNNTFCSMLCTLQCSTMLIHNHNTHTQLIHY